jgi:hypothetical protein
MQKITDMMFSNLSYADEYIRAFFTARQEFTEYWCSLRGYDINNLTEAQKNELQNNHDYARPSIEILPYGHMTIDDERLLRMYSKGVDCAIELGTLFGRGAAILSKQANYVVTIDNYADPNFGGMYHTIDTVRYRLRNYHNILPLNRSTHESAMFLRESINNKFQLLFIDADHSYDGVKSDFYHWISLMDPGSYILFHDNSKHHPGVVQFVEELKKSTVVCFPKQNLIIDLDFIEQSKEGEGSIAVFRKS